MNSKASTEAESVDDGRSGKGYVEPDELSPEARERDPKIELIYVAVAVAVFIALIALERYIWAVIWFMTTFFLFGVWRIARGRFR